MGTLIIVPISVEEESEAKSGIQSHTAGKRQSQDVIPASRAPRCGSVIFAQLHRLGNRASAGSIPAEGHRVRRGWSPAGGAGAKKGGEHLGQMTSLSVPRFPPLEASVLKFPPRPGVGGLKGIIPVTLCTACRSPAPPVQSWL